MIDPTSVNSFVNTLLSFSPSAESALLLTMRQPEVIPVASTLLLQNGYLGCLPFAHTGADEIVVRLLPNQALKDSPIAVAWGDVTEGMTIAPDLSHFIAGRIAQLRLSDDEFLAQAVKEELIASASLLNDVSYTKSVLTQLDEIAQLDPFIRRAHLWRASNSPHPLIETLYAVWCLKHTELQDWITAAFPRLSPIDIFLRVYVSFQIKTQFPLEQTFETIADLINRDQIFDSTYRYKTRGSRSGAWATSPVVRAVGKLHNYGISLENVDPALWAASVAHANDPIEYNGYLHYEYAQKIASEDPVSAYTHVANSAGFYARATQRIPLHELIFAYELAEKHGWDDLKTVLGWARTEMGA